MVIVKLRTTSPKILSETDSRFDKNSNCHQPFYHVFILQKLLMHCWKESKIFRVFLSDFIFAEIFVEGADVLQYKRKITNELGEEIFNCMLCGKISKDNSNLRRHMIVMHSRPTNHPCNYCNEVFKNSYALRRHQRETCPMRNMPFDAPS